MQQYVRPSATAPVFRDADGEVILYGDRWGARQAPDDSYSVTSNLERFQPLHAVAQALIDHLVENFDVTVDDVDGSSELFHSRTDVIRAVRLTPRSADGAPLTFVFTSFPSMIVVAGAATELLYPHCGCDACDEEWERTADDLEWQALAVAAGNLAERQIQGAELEFRSRISAADGSSGSNTLAVLATPERVARAVAALSDHARSWSAWPPRPRTGGSV